MNLSSIRSLFLLLVLWALAGCANIVPPMGGKKDVKGPRLVSVTPGDSLLNTRVTRFDMRFDEYVDPSLSASGITVSPLLPFPISATVSGHKVTVKIPDSLLSENTTYRVSFGTAIKDLHEGNPFTNYVYVFSTGSYFDSLQLGGSVIDAITGNPDTAALIMLYAASKSDSVVVKEKPLYVTKVSPGGQFYFAGLPERHFRIYALRDANSNMIYDGGTEAIGFIDEILVPTDSVVAPVKLQVFVEESIDTAKKVEEQTTGKRAARREAKEDFTYRLNLDTNIQKRTFDVTKPVLINFSKEVDSINPARIFLSYDSAGTVVEIPFDIKQDTTKENEVYRLNAKWKEDAVYTLRLLKGFARDSSGAETMPSKYIFRTQNDDDYAKLHVHLPPQYTGDSFLLLVSIDADTVHYKPVTDSLVHLSKLRPGNYNMKLVKDSNRNGKWDTGDLFAKKQPEVVIPYGSPIQLKAGWDNTIDFVKEDKKPGVGASPGKRDTKAPK